MLNLVQKLYKNMQLATLGMLKTTPNKAEYKSPVIRQ